MLLVAFDLEGPLTPTDHAYELMALLPQGRELFERISRYDDLLTLSGREGYQAGDTLKLIIPFLLVHGINDEEVTKISRATPLTPGAEDCVAQIRDRGWSVGIITTGYQPHALSVGDRLGIAQEMIVATSVQFDLWDSLVTDDAEAFILAYQEKILRVPLEDDETLQKVMDEFFWSHLVNYPMGIVLETVVVGGRKKVESVTQMADRYGVDLTRCAFVGDSITDSEVLRYLKVSGGLSLVFNGNEYALASGQVGVAGDDLTAILAVLDAFDRGGPDSARHFVNAPPPDARHFYQWLTDENWREALPVHRKFRSQLRGRAARLG